MKVRRSQLKTVNSGYRRLVQERMQCVGSEDQPIACCERAHRYNKGTYKSTKSQRRQVIGCESVPGWL